MAYDTAPAVPAVEKLPRWLVVAKEEIGVKEIAGGEHNPRIITYHATTSLGASDDETPWCSSFANWVMKQAGYAGTSSASARSWEKWGVGLERPKLGCIAVLSRGSKSWQGHVGFVSAWDDERILVVGGNQSNSVNEQWFPRTQVIAYRMPKTAANSKTVWATLTAAGSTAVGEGAETVAQVATQVATQAASKTAEAAEAVQTVEALSGWEFAKNLIEPVAHMSGPIKTICAVLTFAALAVVVYERVLKNRTGAIG